jgi:hypothetical protein
VLERKRQLFAELIEQNGPPPALGLTEDDIFGLFGSLASGHRRRDNHVRKDIPVPGGMP